MVPPIWVLVGLVLGEDQAAEAEPAAAEAEDQPFSRFEFEYSFKGRGG